MRIANTLVIEITPKMVAIRKDGSDRTPEQAANWLNDNREALTFSIHEALGDMIAHIESDQLELPL